MVEHLIPAPEGQRQMNFCEFEARLVYTVSPRTARATQRNPAEGGKSIYLGTHLQF